MNQLSLADRFDDLVRSHATTEAVSDMGRLQTYGELARVSAGVAHQLIACGVESGDRVVLVFDRGASSCAALFGVLKCGAIAVPLVPSCPADRLRQVVAGTEPKMIVTDRARASAVRAATADTTPVVEIETCPPAPPRSWPAVRGADAALMLHTSGSLGRPRGVIHTHDTVWKRVDRLDDVLGPRRGDRIASFSTFAVGQGSTNMFCALLSGATLCPFDVRREGVTRLVRWLAEERITMFISSATLLRSIARSVDVPPSLPGLRLVRLASERVTPEDVVACRRLFPGARLLVSFSTTETGPITMHDVGPDELFSNGVVPIGRPLAGMSISVLDEGGRAVPPGDEGEIAVQSAFLMRGYWRDAPASAESLAPVASTPGEHVYRTGDLGRMRADGLLEHRGRKDLRVKVRGFRVEIEEVETRLVQHPEVARAAVAARPGPDGDVRLVGYIQPVPGGAPSVESLRAHLATTLPDDAIPAVFVTLEELPQTDSGKIARWRLPEPTTARPHLSTGWAPPRTPVEETIAAVWMEILGLESVGVHDGFVALGGDSLNATRVASRLMSRLGVDLPLWEIFEASTIAELAAVVDRHAGGGEPS